MNCTRPTLLNVYQYGNKKIIRRKYNRPYEELQDQIEKTGKEKILHLTKSEKEKYEIKQDYIRVIITFSEIIPCGQCTNCLKERAKKLTDRIILDIEETNTIPYFLTITYNEDNLPKPPLLSKEDAHEVIRKIKKDYPKAKYLLAGEYGSKNGRPHYHILIWNIENFEKKFKDQIPRVAGKNYITYQVKSKYWTKGEITIAKDTTPGTIAYICQYAEKKRMRTKEEKEEWKKKGIIPEFQIMTKGIAFNYYENHKEELIKNHGKYVDETHNTKIVDKSFIDYIKKTNPEITGKEIYGEIETTYEEKKDKIQQYEQRELNAKNNNQRKERK